MQRQQIPHAEKLRKQQYSRAVQQPPIFAQLTGSRKCEALGVIAIGNVPVLDLCRALIAAGFNPDHLLDVYRAGTLALRVRSLRAGARLTVKEPDRGRIHLAKWNAFSPSPVQSPMRQMVGGFSSEADGRVAR